MGEWSIERAENISVAGDEAVREGGWPSMRLESWAGDRLWAGCIDAVKGPLICFKSR